MESEKNSSLLLDQSASNKSDLSESKNQTPREKIEIRSQREKDTILLINSNEKSNPNVFSKAHLKTELNLIKESKEKISIPKMEGPDIKVSRHFFENNEIGDVYSKYEFDGGFAACDAWVQELHEYYIPDGMPMQLFKLKTFKSDWFDKSFFDQVFYENSLLIYFKFNFYDYSGDSGTTYVFQTIFKNVENNFFYKHYFFYGYPHLKNLTCFCDKNFNLRWEYLLYLKRIRDNKSEGMTGEDSQIGLVFKKLVISPKIIVKSVFRYLPTDFCWPWKLQK